MMTKQRVFRIPDEVYDAAQAEAEANGETVTDVVVRALVAYTKSRRLPLSLNLSDAELERLDEAAQQAGVSRVEMSRRLVHDALTNNIRKGGVPQRQG